MSPGPAALPVLGNVAVCVLLSLETLSRMMWLNQPPPHTHLIYSHAQSTSTGPMEYLMIAQTCLLHRRMLAALPGVSFLPLLFKIVPILQDPIPILMLH